METKGEDSEAMDAPHGASHLPCPSTELSELASAVGFSGLKDLHIRVPEMPDVFGEMARASEGLMRSFDEANERLVNTRNALACAWDFQGLKELRIRIPELPDAFGQVARVTDDLMQSFNEANERLASTTNALTGAWDFQGLKDLHIRLPELPDALGQMARASDDLIQSFNEANERLASTTNALAGAWDLQGLKDVHICVPEMPDMFGEMARASDSLLRSFDEANKRLVSTTNALAGAWDLQGLKDLQITLSKSWDAYLLIPAIRILRLYLTMSLNFRPR